MAKRAVVIGTGAGGLTASVTLAQGGLRRHRPRARQAAGRVPQPIRAAALPLRPGRALRGSGGARTGPAPDPAARGRGCVRALLSRWTRTASTCCASRTSSCASRWGSTASATASWRSSPRTSARFDAFIQKLTGLHALINGSGRDPRRLMGLPVAALWYRRTFGELLTQSFSNPRVRSVFAAQCGDYGSAAEQGAGHLGRSGLPTLHRRLLFPARRQRRPARRAGGPRVARTAPCTAAAPRWLASTREGRRVTGVTLGRRRAHRRRRGDLGGGSEAHLWELPALARCCPASMRKQGEEDAAVGGQHLLVPGSRARPARPRHGRLQRVGLPHLGRGGCVRAGQLDGPPLGRLRRSSCHPTR